MDQNEDLTSILVFARLGYILLIFDLTLKHNITLPPLGFYPNFFFCLFKLDLTLLYDGSYGMIYRVYLKGKGPAGTNFFRSNSNDVSFPCLITLTKT